MKTFKDFIKNKENILLWDSSHKEQRDKKKKKHKTHVKESVVVKKKPKDDKEWWGFSDHENHTHTNYLGATYNGHFHGSDDVRPDEGLTEDHKKYIAHYCSTPSTDIIHGHASSANMNGYLRNRGGDRKSGIAYKHSEGNVKDSIRKLSSAFNEKSTNRVPITTYGGVPHHIGEALQNSGKDSKHTLAGFTSTSLSKNTAKGFGENYHNGDKPTHIIKYHIQPGAGLSVARYSKYAENEVLLHHGAHITYKKTTNHKDEWGNPVHVHHVIVHNTHKPLHEYSVYRHNKDLDDIK